MRATGGITMVKQRLRSAIESSTIKSLSDEFTRSFEHSTLSRVCTRLHGITRASRVYRWLTAETEPTAIVIDLRETHTVGPVLAVLDAVTPPVTRLWENSGLVSVARAIENTLSGSKAAKLAAKFFEPPELPENRERE